MLGQSQPLRWMDEWNNHSPVEEKITEIFDGFGTEVGKYLVITVRIAIGLALHHILKISCDVKDLSNQSH